MAWHLVGKRGELGLVLGDEEVMSSIPVGGGLIP
jgi:hypothetical protein